MHHCNNFGALLHCPLLPTYGLKKNYVKHNNLFPFKMIHQEKSHKAVLIAFSYTFCCYYCSAVAQVFLSCKRVLIIGYRSLSTGFRRRTKLRRRRFNFQVHERGAGSGRTGRGVLRERPPASSETRQ